MSGQTDTIFALATGYIKAGVAIIRVSGPLAATVAANVCQVSLPSHCKAKFCAFKNPRTGEIIDKGIMIFFAAPASYTGEDILELQIHGGMAVITSVLKTLSEIKGLRPALGGEFTRRAVLNGKMDLTAAEAVADLVDAGTDEQRRQALRQMDGSLFKLYDDWQNRLTRVLAHLEAYIDFPEDDVPEDTATSLTKEINNLLKEINNHLDDNKRGEHLRTGFHITIIGAPNSGKSSLLNRLLQKDVAIVSQIAGTTRDVIEVYLDIDGFPVILADTAGLHEAEGEIEAEGIRRALARAEDSDMIMAVFDGEKGSCLDKKTLRLVKNNDLKIINKSDLSIPSPALIAEGFISVSAKTGAGIDILRERIAAEVREKLALRPHPSLTRERHRTDLTACCEDLNRALNEKQLDLKTENIRLAVRSLGSIMGKVNIEDVLDIVFKDFCIGK